MQQKLTCAIYTRVSTDMQAEVEFNSCEAQEAKIRSFINSQENMEITQVYPDAGFTGANTDRPALAQMLDDIRIGKINLVIAYKIDRLTRSPKDFYQLIEVFDKYGVNFISVTERFDTSTPSGRLLRNIMLTFGQFERELTSERTKDKLMERANKGMWNGGGIPFGYKNENKKLVVDPKNAAIVKKMFADYITTQSLAKVCNNLRSLGATYQDGRGFTTTAVSYILRNGVYTGKVRFSGKLMPGNHDPIISNEVFEQAQKVHKTIGRVLRHYSAHALAGLIRCQECGSSMSPCHTNKKKRGRIKQYRYYRCTKTSKNHWDACSTRQVSAKRLDNYIFDNLERISLDRQYIESMLSHLDTPEQFGKPPVLRDKGVHSGHELRGACPKISPEIFSQTLAVAVKSLSQAREGEKNLLCRKLIQSINYSKESIEIRLFARADFPASEKENFCRTGGGDSSRENEWRPI
jgi:site-specific DNA recombinase